MTTINAPSNRSMTGKLKDMAVMDSFESSSDRPETGDSRFVVHRKATKKSGFLIIPKRKARELIELEMRQPLPVPLISQKGSPGMQYLSKFKGKLSKTREDEKASGGFSKLANFQVDIRNTKLKSDLLNVKSTNLASIDCSPINNVHMHDYTSRSNMAPSIKPTARDRCESSRTKEFKEIEQRNQSLRELAAQIFNTHQPRRPQIKHIDESNNKRRHGAFANKSPMPAALDGSYGSARAAMGSLTRLDVSGDRSRGPDWMSTGSGISFSKSRSYVKDMLKDAIRMRYRRKAVAGIAKQSITLHVKDANFMLKKRPILI